MICYVVALKGGTKRDTAKPQAKRYSNVPPSRAARDENIFFLFFSAINNDDTYVSYDVPIFMTESRTGTFNILLRICGRKYMVTQHVIRILEKGPKLLTIGSM